VSDAATTRRGIPEASVARLPGYLRALTALGTQGVVSVSSDELASAAGVSSAMLRKDLSHLGSYGVRGVGYDVERLASEITAALGLTQDWPVAIVGMGNLGRALAAYGGFAERGFEVIALLDGDPRVVGDEVAGRRVRPMADLTALVSAGVRSVLNFAPAVLAVPEGVVVRNVDLSTELQILAFHGQRVAVAQVASS
jgi:redox-sensing transcriptional repressor